MKLSFIVGLLLLLIMAACSPAATSPTPAPPAPTNTPEVTAEASLLADVLSAGAERPAWQTVSLVNAATNENFTLADFAGKTVYVEPMATWCTNCRAQQGQVRATREQLGEENYVFISLSVEPNDTTAGLAEYLVRENFPWTFAIAPTEMVQSLVEQFGRTITNPPSTPHFVISPTGAVSQLMTGQHSAERLVAELTAATGA
jgi:cytochrome oxidase Cu insertion factor (SCO1/SenC/PrrC family)